mmetsp:Transcript_27632/g.75278  ORF Transcript_27632/g.75278 Transcript_27632/m.75278 type:complete len:201 (-) Transcript_27632:1668-2270(-)
MPGDRLQHDGHGHLRLLHHLWHGPCDPRPGRLHVARCYVPLHGAQVSLKFEEVEILTQGLGQQSGCGVVRTAWLIGTVLATHAHASYPPARLTQLANPTRALARPLPRFVLRLFWCAVIFTSFTGISLAWVKFKVTPRAGVVTVFLTFAVIIVSYIQLVVREKFKFPEDTHKKPDDFLLNDGYDPEHGTVKAQLKSAYGA